MATTRKLVLTFTCEDGKTHNFSYKYVSSSPSKSNVIALRDGMITNGSIFANVPVKLEKAELVTTSSAVYDLDD